jgi:exosome complex RNA-binding protein Rrp4
MDIMFKIGVPFLFAYIDHVGSNAQNLTKAIMDILVGVNGLIEVGGTQEVIMFWCR